MPDDPTRLHALPPARSLVPFDRARSLICICHASEAEPFRLGYYARISMKEAAAAYRRSMRPRQRVVPILGNGIFA